MSTFRWSPAIRRGDLARLDAFLKTLEEAGAQEIHLDVMDGIVSPEPGLGMDLIRAARECTSLPCEIHVQAAATERLLPAILAAGCEHVTIHVEHCVHVHRALGQIREAGASPGIAIAPATPLTALEYLLPSVDRVLLVSNEAGADGRLPGATSERVRMLHESIEYDELRITLAVEADASAGDSAKLIRHGADLIVLDSASVPGTSDVGNVMAAYCGEVADALPVV